MGLSRKDRSVSEPARHLDLRQIVKQRLNSADRKGRDNDGAASFRRRAHDFLYDALRIDFGV